MDGQEPPSWQVTEEAEMGVLGMTATKVSSPADVAWSGFLYAGRGQRCLKLRLYI